VIAQIVRGSSMPDLASYLFGPGKHNEHVNQHLVAGYADSVFTADDTLWRSEPGMRRRLRDEARELGWQVEYPHSRWQTEVPRGYVWHCSLSLKAAEGALTDAQWTQAVHILIDGLGFSGSDGKAPCRWIAVRHGLSSEGNDHIHVAVNLVREDGTKASTWNDYRRAGKACAEIEERFGLEHVPGRITHRSVPEPSRADREISAARGDSDPLRVRLERTVRACAAAARSEAHFVALARGNGLLIRPRYAGNPGGARAVTGYAVADRHGRHAYSRKTGMIGPIWFGGGTLATDLTLPALRRRWEPAATSPAAARAGALAAWSAAASLDDPLPAPQKAHPGQLNQIGHDTTAAADLLAAAAGGLERGSPGPLSQAARHMARAAQHTPPAPRRPEVMAVVGDMAATFLAITQSSPAAPAAALTLMREVALLVDACAATATATRDTRRARTLVNATIGMLTQAASRQSTTALATTRRITMTAELTHEEEFLTHLTTAGITGARLFRAAVGQPAADSADVQGLRRAGYTETTPFDECLRRELGERRWAWYVADPARIVCAAQITDAAAAGRDVPAVLRKVCEQRAWEDDARSPAKSIARVLSYRIEQELARPAPRTAPPSHQKPGIGRTYGGASPARATAEPMSATQWDDHLRRLLGDRRWDQYAGSGRRRDIARLLTAAHADGHDIDALLVKAISRRDWEDDERSPSRSTGGVLHHRVKALIATGEFQTTRSSGELPSKVAHLVARAAAPAGGQRADTETPPPRRPAPQQPDRERG